MRIVVSEDGKRVDVDYSEERAADCKAGRFGRAQYISWDGWGRLCFSEGAWNDLFREVAKQVKAQEAHDVVGVLEAADRVRVTFGDEKTGTTVLMLRTDYETLRQEMLKDAVATLKRELEDARTEAATLREALTEEQAEVAFLRQRIEDELP